MDQKSMIVVFHMKGLSANDVHTELGKVLGSDDDDVIADSIVTRHRQNDVISQNEPEPEADDRAEDQGFSITDNAILEAFERMPFLSIHQINKMTFMPLTTGFHRLTKSLPFISK
jgi:hypothetical protein